MNKVEVIKKLKELHPGANIVLNPKGNPTEIVAEIDPQNGQAVAVIDKSVVHHHNHTKEKYTVINGEMDIYINGKKHHLAANDALEIEPGQSHYAEGNETWVAVIATPPWSPEDHILEDTK